jgi:hypothetical protein
MELEKNSCQEAAYIDVFGEEHPGRVRGMGFGVCPSKVLGTGRSSSTSQAGGITLVEWNSMKSELQESNAKVKVLEEKMNFFIQHFGGQIPPNI